MDVVADFFRAMPGLFRELWEFGDPRNQGNGWLGVAITLGSAALVAGFLFLARLWHGTREWLAAVSGGMAVTIAFFWVFGILPSAWVYFVDGNADQFAGVVIPEALPGMTNFYQVFRDSVVILETTIGLIGLAVVAGWVQRNYPRSLAPGEEKAPASGGYK